MSSGPSVVVVGAGIIGASIAWHLARGGATVRVLDAATAGGVATRASWAWINASWGNPEPYFRLRLRSMAMWGALGRNLPGLDVRWPGSLLWDLDPQALAEFAQQHKSWGYPVRLLDRPEIGELEPALVSPPEQAALVSIEGVVEPAEATRTLLAAADVPVEEGREVTGLVLSGGRVAGVATDDGDETADAVVVAAGLGSRALLQSAGYELPLDASPGLLVETDPVEPLLQRLLIAPWGEVRQTADGRILAAADIDAGSAEQGAEARAGEVLDLVRANVRVEGSLTLSRFAVGWRPMPRDGAPILGKVTDGLYVAATHSGVTLAPVIGALIAQAVASGRQTAALEPWGLDRFSLRADEGALSGSPENSGETA